MMSRWDVMAYSFASAVRGIFCVLLMISIVFFVVDLSAFSTFDATSFLTMGLSTAMIAVCNSEIKTIKKRSREE